MTKKSVFGLPGGPDYVVLYQKNIEAVCSSEAEVRHQIRQTVIHEMGHYFGMTEERRRCEDFDNFRVPNERIARRLNRRSLRSA